MIDLIKEKPYFIPKILLSNYKSLGMTDEELIVIITIMNYGDKVVYDPELFAKDIGSDRKNVMMIIDSLCDKNLLSVVIEKNNKKTYEYISIDILYEKLLNIVLGKEEKIEPDDSVFGLFETELGRTLSPMEYEKIKEWITSGNSNELIVLALKEAVLNGVSNLNYIDRILSSWRKKGYKNESDILKDKENYRTKKEKIQIYDTDWLNE